MDAAQINFLADAAVTAIGDGDYATALNKALAVQAVLAAMPDQTGLGGAELRWDRNSIDKLISNIRRQQAATDATTGLARGMTSVPLEFKRPRDAACYP